MLRKQEKLDTAVKQEFEDWQNSILEYMHAHGMNEYSEIVICYKDLFKQLKLQKMSMLFAIRKAHLSP